MRIVDERDQRFGRPNADARDTLQLPDRWIGFRESGKFLFHTVNLMRERLDFLNEQIPFQGMHVHALARCKTSGAACDGQSWSEDTTAPGASANAERSRHPPLHQQSYDLMAPNAAKQE